VLLVSGVGLGAARHPLRDWLWSDSASRSLAFYIVYSKGPRVTRRNRAVLHVPHRRRILDVTPPPASLTMGWIRDVLALGVFDPGPLLLLRRASLPARVQAGIVATMEPWSPCSAALFLGGTSRTIQYWRDLSGGALLAGIESRRPRRR
jgi:hypothetical protein